MGIISNFIGELFAPNIPKWHRELIERVEQLEQRLDLADSSPCYRHPGRTRPVGDVITLKPDGRVFFSRLRNGDKLPSDDLLYLDAGEKVRWLASVDEITPFLIKNLISSYDTSHYSICELVPYDDKGRAALMTWFN